MYPTLDLFVYYSHNGRLKKIFFIFSQVRWKWFSQVCLNNHEDKTRLSLFLVSSLDTTLYIAAVSTSSLWDPQSKKPVVFLLISALGLRHFFFSIIVEGKKKITRPERWNRFPIRHFYLFIQAFLIAFPSLDLPPSRHFSWESNYRQHQTAYKHFQSQFLL